MIANLVSTYDKQIPSNALLGHKMISFCSIEHNNIRGLLSFVEVYKKKKEKTLNVVLNALSLPDFVIPRSLSTLYKCLLTTMAQDIPFQKIPLIRDCCNLKGRCTLVRPYLTIAAGISSLSFIRVSTRQLAVGSLSKRISSTLNFHKRISTDGTQKSQPHAPQASVVSIELTWLHLTIYTFH